MFIFKLKSPKFIKILLAATIITASISVTNVFAQSEKINTPIKTLRDLKMDLKKSQIPLVEKQKEEPDDEKVIISIINFGRKNPFRPYTKISIVDTQSTVTEDIPFPPRYNPEVQNQIRELMNAKVNGILYDPYARSSAIINIQGIDYMVNVGDSLSGFEVAGISKELVTLKYGANTYSVGVGQAIDNSNDSINYEPVLRKGRNFAGQSYDLPELELEEL